MLKALYVLNAIFIALYITSQPTLYADTIHLKGGSTLDGKILEETDDSIVILTQFGKATIERNRIVKIEYKISTEETFEKMKEAVDEKDADSLFDFAMWCKENGKKREYSQYLKRALKVDDQHDAANRELGNIPFDDKWFSADELEQYKKDKTERMKAQGMVLFEGEWMPEWEAKKRKGYVDFEGRWISRLEHYRILGERDIPKIFGHAMTITDSEHFTIRSQLSEEEHRELLDYCELEYEHFMRTFNPDPTERKIISYYPIPIYILEDIEESILFVKSGYIKRYNPPKKDESQYRPEHNFSIYFPRPLVVMTQGAHLVGSKDPSVSQIGFMAHHIGHILIRRFKRGGKLPGWIESGVAHYYEGLTNFYQTLSICDYKGFESVKKWTPGWGNFLEWRKMLREKKNHDRLPSIETLFSMEIETLNSWYMAKAWSVTAFLLKHHREEFVEFIRRSYAPYRGERKLSQPEAWTLAFNDKTYQLIEEEWRAWIVEQSIIPDREDKLELK